MHHLLHKFIALVLFLTLLAGCAYYNTMFNANEKYETGERLLSQSKGKEITPEIRKDFYDAIDKCWKLINIYGDSSTYADDALLLIGKSHFQVEEFIKSERYLRQFLSRYPKSDLIAEANLWLGKSLVNLDRDDEAIMFLNEALDADKSDEMNSDALLSLGNINFKQKNYKKARTNLEQVIDISYSDDLDARAQYLIAESFFEEGKYAEAAANFNLVSDYKTQIDFLFDAFMRRIDCMVEMGQLDQAVELLDENSTNNRFLHKNSVMRARIADIYKDEGKFIEATNEYDDVLKKYPRTEGSAMAAFGMAQLMEFAYSDLDSARALYQRVGQEYRQSDLTEYAEKRARMLDQYQKIEANIKRDLDDLQKIETAVEDSSSVTENQQQVTENQQQVTEENGTNQPKQAVSRKPAIRSKEEILSSLQKNKFAKAEFFLLTLANNDSAVALYKAFTKLSADTALVPKAYYALYYIYAHELEMPDKADSIRQIILQDYPETSYAAYFKSKKTTARKITDDDSLYKHLYEEGETLMFDGRFEEAIDIFTQIAVEDSGSEFAKKARYASAWIYEKKLDDIPGAVHAYTILANEYPQSEAGKLAKEKIKEPVEEPSPIDSTKGGSEGQPPGPEPVNSDTGHQGAAIEQLPSPDEIGKSETTLQEAVPDSTK